MASNTSFTKSVDVAANKTLTAADAGIVQNVTVDGVIITLPATANGLEYQIRNGGGKVNALGPAGAVTDGGALVSVLPATGDGFTGNGFAAAINKKALNTKATSLVGDFIRIQGNGTTGATAWTIVSTSGIWAREA